jgi:NADH dehydrogenase (ubiquinone) 1 beta subcomplex subunit 5
MGGLSKCLNPSSGIVRSSLLFLKSSLKANTGQLVKSSLNSQLLATQVRSSHGRVMDIRPGKFYSKKIFDMFHFHLVIASMPFLLIIGYHYVFIGPGTLTEIPEGYEPRSWEHVKHPLRRSIAKYITPLPEQGYEITLHELYTEQCKIKMRQLSRKVQNLMKERQDYKAWYYVPVQKEAYERKSEYVQLGKDKGYTILKPTSSSSD